MLPRSSRLRSAEDFRRTVRGGVRVGRSSLVLHGAATSDRTGVRVGFVVSRAVGSAVVRNRVKRRLRHLAASRLATTPDGTDLVVRALPRAATDPDALPRDLGSAWPQLLSRMERRA